MVENAVKVCHNEIINNKCDDIIQNEYFGEDASISAKEYGWGRQNK